MMNGHKFDFTSSDVVNIIALVYDYSGSMSSDVSAIRKANKAFYSDFSRFEEKASVAIAKAAFNENFSMTPFKTVSSFDTSYYAHGGTRLYDAISKAGSETIEYYNELVKRLNIRPRITFLVFTDGLDNSSTTKFNAAKQMIAKLNSLDATTVFVAFRDAISGCIGDKLGFTCTKDISSVEELISCLGAELSQSCKEQSKSPVSLKSAFFSKAAPTPTEDAVKDADDMLSDSFFSID